MNPPPDLLAGNFNSMNPPPDLLAGGFNSMNPPPGSSMDAVAELSPNSVQEEAGSVNSMMLKGAEDLIDSEETGELSDLAGNEVAIAEAHVEVLSINSEETRVRTAGPGENVCVKLSGMEEENILSAFVLSSAVNPIGVVFDFNAQLQILELIDNTILTAGYKAVLHINAIVEECEIVDLLKEIDLKKR